MGHVGVLSVSGSPLTKESPTMSFLAALEDAKAEAHKGPQCSMGTILKTSDDADAIQAALNDDSLTGTLIAKALVKAGHTVRSEAVQRHRRHACDCDQK